ncbi:MAG: tRNA 2-thiouridine(34) synthase MnmA [Candidatus Omnitrophota bacterium]|jgi:tRNA-specific 2-thiouridylase
MRVVIAMSGGVDSSVAALELKREGHEVIGMTIKTWPKEECGSVGEKLCCSLEAVKFAKSVAGDLKIPHHVVDLSKEFTSVVKDYFAQEYSKGRTPNPCIYCNSRIKFGYLLQKARELGAKRIATGHYARILRSNEKSFLIEALDKWRDQSYFLYDIPRETLPFVELPLGRYSKDWVREVAASHGLMTANRESSQDICFAAAEGDYRTFLKKSGVTAFEPGPILDVNGKIVGEHKGIASYTVGQRKGLGLAMPEPVYVLKIDPARNEITVGLKEHAMNRKIRVGGFNWLMLDKLEKPTKFETKIRYNSVKVPALVTPWGEDEAVVEFKEPQFAPTPGQAAVFYMNEKVAGGAWIEEVLE